MQAELDINLSKYQYNLPDDKIAKHGRKDRDGSKLLYYKSGAISHHTFKEITNLISPNSTLFFNNTEVIQARIKLFRATGAAIEIFLLNPIIPSKEIVSVMSETKSCSWRCEIGNLKKWKEEEVLTSTIIVNGQSSNIHAVLDNKEYKQVRFYWDSGTSFGEILDKLGHTPLPPYLNRKDQPDDKGRYQTVYSQIQGAVAAPTAGLHFTKEVLENLSLKNIKKEFLTLHVSAGTFKPIKSKNITEHPMHNESLIISLENLESILKSKNIIPVGTTSMRVLESVYWYGVGLLKGKLNKFHIPKLMPYQYNEELPSRNEAIKAVITMLKSEKNSNLKGDTEILIFPGYKFRVCDGLVTNFHQPSSTLILLVAALIGDRWKEVYDEALTNNYKFLSYGDSSLLIP